MGGRLIAFLLLTATATAQAQQYAGHVADREDGKPVAGAIVTATDAEGKRLGYTITSSGGDFTLALKSPASRLAFSMMGYRLLSVPAKREPIVVLMTPQATDIREVTIRAPRLTARGDTVRYNVAAFSEAQDRSIEDVLRKMPGIEVAPSGAIKYNGEPIGNFYIEGLDMLDGRYSLATRNISQQDVASVEIMENHQPIKALKDIVFSDKAALNLRLKPHARSHWTGTVNGSGGGAPFLWNAGLFAMRIGAGEQSMVNLKSDATGQNPAAENDRLTVDELLNGRDNDYRPKEYIRTGTASAPLDAHRTRFNRTHLATANNLWKLSDDYQLSSAVSYGYDRTTSDFAARKSWFLPDGTQIDTEQATARQRGQELTTRLSLQANTERFYLTEKLEAAFKWNDSYAALAGSYPNRQRASAPVYGLENDLKYIRRTDKRSVTITSHMKYVSQPQSLNVRRTIGTQRQTLWGNVFFMNHNAALGMQRGKFAFTFKGGISALVRRFDSELTGLNLVIDSSNNLSAGYAGAYVQPAATYRSRKLRMTLDLPVGYRHYWYDNRNTFEQHPAETFIWNSRLFLKWSLSARLTATASGNIGKSAPEEDRMGTGAILQNYRTLSSGTACYGQSLQRSVSAGIAYKNPIGGLFVNLHAQRAWNDLPFLPVRQFAGDYIVDGYLRHTNRIASWVVAGDISHSVDALHGQIGAGIGYTTSNMQTMQNGTVMHHANTSLTFTPRFNIRFARWCNLEYELTYRRTRLTVDDLSPEVHHSFNQQLSINLLPVKKLILSITGEHYYTQLAADSSKHLLLADVSVRWIIGNRWEVTGTATNVFNQSSYSYTLFDGLSSITYRYAIRPRNLLLGATWKF